MDMKTARFCYGAPELHMGWVLQAQIAHYLGLPSFGQGGCNDAKCPDAQAGAEAAMSALLVALGGINLIHNVATTAMGDAGCLEMIVICDEILGYVLRILREIEIKEERLPLMSLRRWVQEGTSCPKDTLSISSRRNCMRPRFSTGPPTRHGPIVGRRMLGGCKRKGQRDP